MFVISVWSQAPRQLDNGKSCMLISISVLSRTERGKSRAFPRVRPLEQLAESGQPVESGAWVIFSRSQPGEQKPCFGKWALAISFPFYLHLVSRQHGAVKKKKVNAILKTISC